MKRYARNIGLNSLVIGLLLAGLSGPAAGASDVCSKGLGQPPFLSFGVDSNLLLLLDNSGSMLDPAYVDEDEQCFDETYANAEIYSGYFDRTSWYAYDLAGGTFEVQSVQPAVCSTAEFYGQDASGSKFVCVDLDTATDPDTVLAFVATGNFLNWVTASKFDIQKEILTGGKYDSVNENLQMESRGCLNHRFVKQVALAQGTYKLALGVRGPMETFETWLADTPYSLGDIVQYDNVLYKATVAHTSGDDFDSSKWDVYKDTRWYPNHSYPANTAVYDVVTKAWYWTQEGGTSLATATNISGDTKITWVPYDGTSIEIYKIVEGGFQADACQQVLDLIATLTGDPSHDGATDNPNTPLGKIKLLTQECMGFAPGGGNTVEQARKSSFNHAMQECWYYNRFGHWQPGGGTVSSMKTSCANVYDFMNPTDITPWDSSYVCAGSYLPENDKSQNGYVGRCWEVPGIPDCTSNIPCPDGRSEDEIWAAGLDDFTCDDNLTYVCVKNTCNQDHDDKPADWKLFEECTTAGGGDIGPDWTNDNFYFFNPCPYRTCPDNNDLLGTCSSTLLNDFTCVDGGLTWTCHENAGDGDQLTDYCFTPDPVGDLCVEQAIKDFCNILSVPEVIDPSDSTGQTDEAWNAPAYLIDSGIIGQLDLPLATLRGYIRQVDGDDADLDVDEPQGILQSTATKLRIGAMAFNAVGAKTECEADDPTDSIEKYCPSSNRDGSQVITRIMLGSIVTDDGLTPADLTDDKTHVDDLAGSINDIRATSWTPLAEAMYNAIGYFTQNTQVRLATADFQTDADVTAGWLANQDYAPDSYLLVSDVLYHTKDGGKSGGNSIADDISNTSDSIDWTVVDTYDLAGWVAGTTYPDRAIIAHDGKLYITYDGGTAVPKGGSPGGPLYDQGMIWEPFIDPVAHWCQENHVLVITEGASTADISPKIINFAEGDTAATAPDGTVYNTFNSVPIVDPDETVADVSTAQCTDGLVGSTYLDDMTYFAWNHDDPDDKESASVFTLYPAGNDTIPSGDLPYTGMAKQAIRTHLVVAGALRDDGTTSECNPKQLMESAAYNGGTSEPLRGENPEELEENLLKIFNALAQRASAGSAASVISSARGGEGAIYQAIFWPELNRDNAAGDDITVAWAGDVHGLFLDNRGYMYEDTNGDRTLTPYEDLDGDGNYDVDEARGEDIDGDGHYDCIFEDISRGVADGHLDVDEDTNDSGTLDPGEDVDGDGFLDTVNEDLDGDGYLDTGEDVNHNGVLDPGENINGGLPPVLNLTEDLDGEGCDLGVDPDAFDPFVDVDGDGHQDVSENLDGDGVFDNVSTLDHRVVIYFDDASGRSKACYNTSIFYSADKTCDPAFIKELNEINFLWSANEWLADASLDTDVNRAAYLSDEKRRYMFTWNDLNNDGIVDQGTEILPLESSTAFGSPDPVDWSTLAVSGRGSVVNDFDADSEAELDMIVNWLRGEDWLVNEDLNNNDVLDSGEDQNGNGRLDEPLRSRQIPDADGSSTMITWRLGDIIHSTPMTVAAPAEGYHLIYNDYSYAQFLTKYKRRRHVVYFGGNDGFLHAVNGGFYIEEEKKFCLSPDLDAAGHCTESLTGNYPALGTELWAYLPYNLQPHVKCLADPAYNHKYFVDLRPRIFDAQIFTEEAECRTTVDGVPGVAAFDTAGCDHPNGWGTILVGGLRFGGTPIKAEELDDEAEDAVADTREFTSSYFILDITNPEHEPVLLGELSRNGAGDLDLGHSAMIPTMVIMKKDDAIDPINRWYLILGSGPRDNYDDLPEDVKAIKGVSDANAKIAVLPLEWLTGKDSGGAKTGLRLPDALPVDGDPNAGGRWDLALSPNGFVSDAITVDFDINPSYLDYKADAVYFGTVQGDFATNASGTSYWNGGGLMYRLVTKNIVNVPLVGDGSPIGRYTTEEVTVPSQWQIKPLIDLRGINQPVTAAASVGTDGYSFWIYFGTGRFFDADDKTDDLQQSYYGIKEPMGKYPYDHDGDPLTPLRDVFVLTWAEVERTGTSNTIPGAKGLLQVDDILVAESPSIRTAALSCLSGGVCLPADIQGNTLYDLDKYIAGTGNCATEPGNNCVDGWYKDFLPNFNREKNVGQATLLGGLVTFTTYQPFNDVCQAEGNAYLYGVYYRTGTAWHENVFGENGLNGDDVADKLDLGRGLATTPNLHVGSGTGDDKGPKAFVQTSTGEIREIEQENLPIKNYRTGRSLWKEYSN